MNTLRLKPPKGRKKSAQEKAVIKEGKRANKLLTKKGKDPLGGFRFKPKPPVVQAFPAKKEFYDVSGPKGANEKDFEESVRRFKQRNKQATVISN